MDAQRNSIYLKPGSLVELLYVVEIARGTDCNRAFEYVKNPSPVFAQILKKPFEFSNCIQTEYEFFQLMSTVSWGPDEFKKRGLDRTPIFLEPYFEELHKYYSPKTTLLNKLTCCGGQAILAISARRRMGIPARIIPARNQHLIYQEYKEEWITRDPRNNMQTNDYKIELHPNFFKNYDHIMEND